MAKHLSHDYLAVNEKVRTLALSDSVAERLGRLLFGRGNKRGRRVAKGIYLKRPLKYGEIA